jgi:hypothetical protein
MFGRWRGFDLFTPLVAMWALIVRLWQPSGRPVSPRARILLRVAALGIALLATIAGVLFWAAIFSESEPWARFMIACFTYGLFGLPTSFIAIAIGAILVHAQVSMGASQGVAVVLLTITYFAQWLLLSVALWRRSMS